MTFLTWRSLTLKYKQQIQTQLDSHLQNDSLEKDWLKYKLLTGLEDVKNHP